MQPNSPSPAVVEGRGLPVPLPQLRAHIQDLLDTHTDAPSLAAALREVFRVEEGWLIPDVLPPSTPAVMLLVSENPTRMTGQLFLRATLMRLGTIQTWSVRTWEVEGADSAKLRPSPPAVGAEPAAVLTGQAILLHLMHALGVFSREAPQPEALVSALLALGLPAEVAKSQRLPSVLVEGWLLERRGDAWQGRCLGGAWAGPLDAIGVATQWAKQLVQGEGKVGQGVRHAAS